MNRSFDKIFLIVLVVAASIELSGATPDDDQIIRAWTLTDLHTEKQIAEIDTMINAFQVHNPLFKQGISYSFLGNAGLAAVSNNYSDRGLYSDFFFIDPFMAYLRHFSETKYYNTKRPFTLIDFSSGGPRGKNEKMLDILHTQNVNPDFNLGFSYFNINSDGQYKQQEAVTNAIALFSSYENVNYQLHASFNLNSARVFENGGLADDSSLYNEGYETEDHPVRLQNARNWIRNNSIFVSQSWQPFLYSGNDTIPESETSMIRRFTLYHVLHMGQFKRTYQDNNPGSGFYPEILLDNTRTFDSVYYHSITNKLMLLLPVFTRGSVSFNAKGGLKNEFLKGNYNVLSDTVYHFNQTEPSEYLFTEPSDTTITDRNEHKFGSNAIIAFARGSIGGVFGIWGEGSLFFHGHRAGEYDFQAGISFNLFEGKNQSIIEGVIRQKESTPSLFLNSFSSNHFSWQNEFSRKGLSSLKGVIIMPERNFRVSTDFTLLNNFIYFDTTANPLQYDDVFPVINFSIEKDFRIWRFYFRNIVKYQVSGNKEILPLPDLSIYHSTSFEQTLIREILNMQIGFDIYYTTSYRGYAYQPATSRFYLHNGRMLGNYPFLDVFINFKHKRTRVFLKAEHLNARWLDPTYFTVLNYPRNERIFKFGVSWSFYN